MKKPTFLVVAVTLALAAISQAQSNGTVKSTQSNDAPFAGPLADRRPTPRASAAPTDNGGKKMIGEAKLAADEKGANATTSFPAGTTTVYLVTKNVSGAKGDQVKAEWFAEDVGKAIPKGKRFYNSSVQLPNTASYNPDFHVTGPIKGVFPSGKYRVDVSVGGEKLKSEKFTVK